MGIDDACNTGLVLGLGFSSTMESPSKLENKNPSFLKLEATSFDDERPSLTLGLSGGGVSYQVTAASAIQKVDVKPATVAGGDLYRQTSPLSTVSLFSNGRVKRERELSEDENEGFNGRKKLRLSKKQSDLLEESFKQLSTLNPKQKQALARQLNLRPRQVEVWFQNRRARTKLKLTEMDSEFLKKCCETLTVENRRLQKEVQELKELKFAQPFYMHMQAATLTMCPSCEKTGDGNSKNPLSMASKPHHLYNNPLTDSSAAC